MSETEQITVAKRSAGFGGTGQAGTEVSLPVVELLTGRGFVTGKSGSGKSNSASVVAERLLDNGFGLLIVDIDGEYYGLKEEYEILHAGADEECDIQISPDHAEKLASLALEQNVPLILDISSYLDESEAEAVLTAVARSLFAKAKKQKQPFLLLVEEVHEYIPENGSVGECGRMLIKIGKRGRKHGLGICGISQRPADVKKDFITQCDWLLWHRLTWNNDTKVVGRILDTDYADAVEDLDDGEGFLMTDWAESIQRVQFFRKQTFDAGATPGLDDFERPELKSVSDDLVSELEAISDEKQKQEDRIQQLREELDHKNSRIAELERELQDARDLSRMAEQFVDSLVEEVKGTEPGRTERERRQKTTAPDLDSGPEIKSPATNGDEPADDGESGGFGAAFAEGGALGDSETVEANSDEETTDTDSEDGAWASDGEVTSADGGAVTASATSEFSADAVMEALNSVTEMESGTGTEDDLETAVRRDTEFIDADSAEPAEVSDSEDVELVVRELKAEISGLAIKTRKMLEFYRETGPETPLNAHFSAGGDGSRTDAYAHNRRLRTSGLVQHAGRGHYEYHVPELLEQRLAERGLTVDEETFEEYVADIEESTLRG